MDTDASDAVLSEVRSDPIVVLIHGIRTQAAWAEMVGAVLEATGRAKVIPIRYGYFDLFRFLVPGIFRNGPVRRIARELRDIQSDHPLSRVSVIAHSFGTYAIERVLAERDVKFYRLILCGSIVGESFRRAHYRAQLGQDDILNDCGTHDIWPPLARSISWGYGATGTFGFGTNGVRDRFHRIGHSDYFNKEFVREYWAPFVHDGVVVPTAWEQERPPTPWWLSLLAWLPLRYIIVAAALVAVWLSVCKYRESGEVAIFIGDELVVGHYLGVTFVVSRLSFQSSCHEDKSLEQIRVSLTSPSGKSQQLQMEAILLAGNAAPPLAQIAIKPGDHFWFDYTFFNYTDSFHAFRAELAQYVSDINLTTSPPDPAKALLPPPVVERARQLTDSLFAWEAGEWAIHVSGRVDDARLTTQRTFRLSSNEVSRMKAIATQYASGIGVFPHWRFVAINDSQPTLQKVLDHE